MYTLAAVLASLGLYLCVVLMHGFPHPQPPKSRCNRNSAQK